MQISQWKQILLNPNFRLENSRSIITPLSLDHLKSLTSIGCDPRIWTYNSRFSCDSEESIKAYIERALRYKESYDRIPFVIFDKKEQRIAGSVSFYGMDEEYQKIAKGYTWYGIEFQRTGLNTSVTSQMYDFVFNTLQCRRLEFHIHSKNEASRKCVEKCGATLEGILRNDCMRFDGQNIDYCVYSILPDEYKQIKDKMNVY